MRTDGTGNIFYPTILSDSTKVYDRPDTSGSVLQVLRFTKALNILAEGDDVNRVNVEAVNENGETYTYIKYTVMRWYKIQLKDQVGYVDASRVASCTFNDPKGLYKYLFLFGKIIKFDYATGQFVDTLQILSFRGDVVRQIDPRGWKNVNLLLSLTMINDYCGGGETTVFVIDANDSLSELIRTESYYDDGGEGGHASMVWLPITFYTGRVRHILNGDVENVLNTYNGELNMYQLPNGLDAAENEVVVFKDVAETAIVDENEEFLFNEDGSQRYIETETLKFLRWNGAELVPIEMDTDKK
ncbi:MAG: hypothetical protein GC178_16540 [Flavobacteriales bacterium]|nr:hypothetical protein [Flavobacteriales bacterium]